MTSSQSILERAPRKPVTLATFVEAVELEKPDELSAALVRKVRPHPWVTRHGSGSNARIRMQLGNLKYERMQGDEIWKRVDEWTMGAPV